MDPYDVIAAFYDWEHESFRDDIDFYREAIWQGPVLEVGVGTGRIAAALLEAGFDVWGIDTSEKMLERARVRLAGYSGVHLLHESIVTMRLDMRFKAIIFSHNALWHLLSPEAQVESLRVARHHLDDGGILVLGQSNPLSLADRGSQGELRQRFRDATGDVTISGFSAAWDDEAQQRLLLSLIYQENARDGTMRTTSSELVLRYVYASELTLMLDLAGYHLRNLYGSYALDAYATDSPALVALASPRKQVRSREQAAR